MKGFRKFLLRGNLIDLAVAVVIGVAFNAVVQALIADIITPLIAAIGGQAQLRRPDLHDQPQQVLLRRCSSTPCSPSSIIAAVIYFLVVAPMNRLTAIAARKQDGHRPGPAPSA